MARKKDTEKQILDQQGFDRKKIIQQKAFLVGVGLKSDKSQDYKESLIELSELSETAGAKVVGSTSQALEKYNSATLIGSGKVKDIAKLVEETEANLVIIDHQLSGAQSLNLEKILKVAVIDRTQLILDIFAKRAHTHEGKLQVELAQMLDQLPRMIGAWMGSLSRQGGGIGTQGPGETALEMDRRRIRKRIDQVKKQLQTVRKRRSQHRSSRKKNRIPTFALIGYTNAGKSTLMNAMTKSSVYVEDQVFATLDPTTRKIYLGDNNNAVITDTVGFIRRLPTKLIEAFKATLEESAEADFLLHVVDLSSDQIDKHIEVVDQLIKEFSWDNKPILYVYNKADLCDEKQKMQAKHFPRIIISAESGFGMDNLKQKMQELMKSVKIKKEIFIPKDKEHIVYDITRELEVEKTESHDAGTLIYAMMTEAEIQKWGPYIQS